MVNFFVQIISTKKKYFPPHHPLYYVPDGAETFLDIGCNCGEAMKDANKLLGVRNVYGIDINPGAIEKAKELLIGVKNYGIFHGSADSIPLPDETVDTALASEVIEHIPASLRGKVIKELHRVTRKGGRLIITIPHNGLFSFLDPANIRLLFPDLFSFLSRHIGGVGREGGYVDQKHGIVPHHHFTLAEIDRLLSPHFKVKLKRWRGCFLIPVCAYGEFYFYRRKLRNNPILKALEKITELDYSLQLGKLLAYDVLLVCERI